MSTTNGTPNPEERKRMVDSALHEFYEKHKPDKLTETGLIEMAACDIAAVVKKQIEQVLSAAKCAGHKFDYASCEATVNKLFLDAFRQWNKDELLQILCALQTGMMMMTIKEAHEQGIF